MPHEIDPSGTYPGKHAFACGQTLTQTLDALFWDAIFSMDISSAEGLSNISTLVRSPSKTTMARNLRGDDAQRLINLIDQVSDSRRRPHGRMLLLTIGQLLTLSHLDEKPSRRFSRLLYKICKACGVLPASYIIQLELTHVGEVEWKGGFADVSKGEHQGRPVAIKHLRVGAKDEFDKIFKVSDCTRSGTSRPPNPSPATLSRSSHLETVVPPEHPATVGSLRVEKPPTFPYHLRVDAQRECDGIH
jgi:hypothetical protein